MSTPAVAWATSADVTSGPCADLASDEDGAALLDAKLLVATQLLYLETGRKWPGVVTDYYRPNSGGSCGCSYGRPGCTRVPEVRLPGYPVVAILSVLIDGATVDDTTYRVDDKRWLVRLPDDDGRNDGWPCCQRMELADSEDRTFSIAYSWGALPDHAGLAAVMALGCEFALAANPDTAGQCRLPKSIVSAITRQGVSYDFTRGIDLPNCGLPEVTLWLSALKADREGSRTGARIIDPAAIARRGRQARRPYVGGS